jgi:poly(ADP-ribose) glycohydrolase ARH3
MRIAPVGIAYRNAPLAVMADAVRAALEPTHHTHPLALEGALCQALGVAQLCRTAPAAAAADGAASGTPPRGALLLLRDLQQALSASGCTAMPERLATMQRALSELHAAHGGPKAGQTWARYFASPAWKHELATAALVAPGEPGGGASQQPHGFQIKGSDAAAAALWAAVAHWQRPADAVVAAVHYGGDTDTIACMAGVCRPVSCCVSAAVAGQRAQLQPHMPATARQRGGT